MRSTIVLLSLLFAGALHAQVAGVTVETVPASPNANTPVTIVVNSACSCPTHLQPIVRNGFTFDVPYNDVCLGTCAPPSQETYDVGVLEPGIYTVRHFPEDDRSVAEVIGTFAVVDAAVPALDWRAMIALAAALSAMGVVALRR